MILHSLIAPIRGVSYILSHPRTWLLILIPYVINTVLIIAFFAYVQSFGVDQVNRLLSIDLFAEYSFVVNVLRAAATVIALILSVFIFLSIGMIVAAPFNAFIIDRLLDENDIQDIFHYKGVKLILFETWRAIKFEIAKLMVSIIFFIPSLLLNFIPVVGNIAFTVFNFIVLSFMTMLDLTDQANSRKGFSFRKKLQLLADNGLLFGPFALITAFLFSIPFINMLFLPIAHVAANILYVDSKNT
ncbi:EI24 domain-containing protein [Candidatus Dojkabacteria bacterium]|uniref:EI24 domain-containing protein n=1 Tax=Candidatus Dojkabacteria bacterium TaxID=2099670 RepID=A0A955L6Z3_9BACT|nr:EI24 domain-containing protein [Candidatus Dojkabacteria bacterium]